jgi:LmbE family N-acetylglucosaminyl deacetylase
VRPFFILQIIQAIALNHILRPRTLYSRLALLIAPVLLSAASSGHGLGVKQLSNPRPVDVVIVAHADDWQVFMGDAIVDRVRAGRRVVFIYLTAGDHGRDSVYWQLRENAALQSTRIAVAMPVSARSSCDPIHVAARAITRCVLGSSVSYFLRLPDGNRNGGGFARNRFESLRRLRAEAVSLDAIDGSQTYARWQDLTTTVATLVRMNVDSTSPADAVLHTTDPSVRANPHDHYDHRMAGKLTENLLRANQWSGRYYVGYALTTRSPNRTTKQRQEKLEVFEAYDREMIRIDRSWSAYREHPVFYSQCMLRTYVRTARAGQAAPHK